MDRWLKGNYHENMSFWKKWHTCPWKQDKIYGETIISEF